MRGTRNDPRTALVSVDHRGSTRLAGMALLVSLAVATAAFAAPTATVRVEANDAEKIDGAVVMVNGKTIGPLPLTLSLQAGRYLVEVVRPGWQPWRKWLDVAAGQSLTLVPTLQLAKAAPSAPFDAPATPRRGTLSVTSSVGSARVFLDGKPIGRTPITAHEELVGPHVIAVRHPDYEEFLATVEVKAGALTRLAVQLRPKQRVETGRSAGLRNRPASEAAQAEPDVLALAPYAAQLVAPAFIAADAAAGFPYLLEARVTTGLFQLEPFAMDVAVALRTYGAVTDVALHTRLRVLHSGPWAVATGLTLGGGGGPKSRNTMFLDLSAIGSVQIERRVSLSARTVINIYSDRHCPENANANELEVCATGLSDATPAEMRDRFTGLRLMFAGIVEVSVTRWLNIFGILEFAPFQGNREAYSDSFASIMPKSDPAVYGRIGVTFKR